MATMSARYTVIDGEVVAQERGGVRHQLVPDPLGSTVALYDDSGTKTDTLSYWPYGENATRTGSTIIPFQYVGNVGYYRDSERIIYIRARFLDVIEGNWITKDNLGFIDGINVYQYCGSNPIAYIDSEGNARIVVVNPGGGKLDHVFIEANCSFGTWFGFWPGTNPVFAIGVIQNPDEHAPKPVLGPLPPIQKKPLPGGCLEPGRSGDILAIENERNDKLFESALCRCIKDSMRKPPLYQCIGHRVYTCSQWAHEMWLCAETIIKVGWRPRPRENLIGR